ncbi:sensor histidine kinase [Labilibacter marinus]|uniref:sensor histidine kinase n=1 Tax=Labilibacter marinus TaxID=1477105 RepID=UPI0009F9AD35|nr:ATP-binding protein [Labilibacter marinus]
MRKLFYLQLARRIVFVLLFSVSATYCFLKEDVHTAFGFAFLLLLIWVILNLFKYLNGVHEQISFFFESILNEDFNSVYALKRKSKVLNQLNENLEKVNQKMQDALMANAQQEQYFKALIEHIGTGVLTCNSEGFVIHANASIKQMLGLEQLTHTKQLQKVDGALLKAVKDIKHKEQRMVSFSIGLNNTPIKILLKAVEFTTGKEHVMLISAQDINKELDENELDSWMKLIRVLTHEIMNSIAPITSLSETVASFYSKDGVPVAKEDINDKTIETTIRALDVIQDQGKGLISFVDSYRSLMRLPKPKKEKIELCDFLEKNVIINQVNGVGIQLNYDNKDKCLNICGDKDQLSQVLINLLKNANYAIEGKDKPEIILWFGRNSKGQVEITVTDNGEGIESDLLEEIFIPFFTTKDSGSGIGLSLSRQIMRLHGGWLKVNSELGKGSRFTMLFQKEEEC